MTTDVEILICIGMVCDFVLVGIAAYRFGFIRGRRAPKATASVDARLDELARVQPGWFNGDGEAVDPETIAFLRQTLPEWMAAGMPRPRLYPTLDGGVQAEWDAHGYSASAEFQATKVTT